jgi:hypothetical protein
MKFEMKFGFVAGTDDVTSNQVSVSAIIIKGLTPAFLEDGVEFYPCKQRPPLSHRFLERLSLLQSMDQGFSHKKSFNNLTQ